MSELLLLTAVRITTMIQNQSLTNASGFFFERGKRLFLITSKHVVFDASTRHNPESIEIELHIDRKNLADSTGFSIPLYREGKGVWRQGEDSGGDIDVAAIEIDRTALPPGTVYEAFTPEHLHQHLEDVPIGTSMLVVGFPLGFHDALHHFPVVRHAINASPLSFRFQGHGYFLTDARTHRGISGAAVVMRTENVPQDSPFPWQLIGIHSSRFDIGTRNIEVDEALGLNCTWFADILMTLTDD
jgi:S1-C subfamily serine protease